MIVPNTHRLSQQMALLVIALVAPTVYAVWGDAAFWPTAWPPWIMPLALLAELGAYVGVLSSQRQVRSLMPALVIATSLMAVRALCVVAAAVPIWLAQSNPLSYSLGAVFTDFWVGSPLVLALQVGLLVLVLPVALHSWAPGFLSQRSLERLTVQARRAAAATQAQTQSPSTETATTKTAHQWAAESLGPLSLKPFIYHLEDLEQYFEKVIGLEGFLITNAEGLVVWEKMPWHIEPPDLAGALARWGLAAAPLVGPGAGDPRRAAVHTGDHWVVAEPLCGGAELFLFFTEHLPAIQVAQTTPRLAEAARALFAYRYSGDASSEAPTPEQEGKRSWNMSSKS